MENYDFDNMNGWNLAVLLRHRPQFANKCDWEKLRGVDWSWLLSKQPQFAKFRGK